MAIRASRLASSTIESHCKSASMLAVGISIASKPTSTSLAERVTMLSTESITVDTVFKALPIAWNGPMVCPL